MTPPTEEAKQEEGHIDDGILANLGAVSWLVLILGGTLLASPFVTPLKNLGPPIIEGFSAIGGPVVVLISIVLVFFKAPSRRVAQKKLRWIPVIGLVCMSAYVALWNQWTLNPPEGREGERRQIGVGLAPWSLTPIASDYLKKHPSTGTQDLMLAFGGWGEPDQVEKIWKPWTISLTGWMLVLLFFAGYALWARCMAYLAIIVGKKK